MYYKNEIVGLVCIDECEIVTEGAQKLSECHDTV